MHCKFAWYLWNQISQREGFVWVIPGSLDDLVKEWKFLPRKSDIILWELSLYMVWSLWNERNAIVCNHKSCYNLEVWDVHLNRIVWWVKAHVKYYPYEVSQFARDFSNIRSLKEKRVVVPWFLPASGIFKVNVDIAAQGCPGRCGIGGIIRNHERKIVGYFSVNLGTVLNFFLHFFNKVVLFSKKKHSQQIFFGQMISL